MRNRLMALPSLFLTTLLIGGSFGCGSGGEEEVKGSVSASTNYSMERASLGTSFETVTSSAGTYQMDATLGSHLSQGRVLSKRYHYLIQHPIGRPVSTEEETAK